MPKWSLIVTPQEIVVNDARKGAEMFNSSIEVPLIGLAENMSWFTPKQHPEEKYYIFGKDGGQKTIQRIRYTIIGTSSFD